MSDDKPDEENILPQPPKQESLVHRGMTLHPLSPDAVPPPPAAPAKSENVSPATRPPADNPGIPKVAVIATEPSSVQSSQPQQIPQVPNKSNELIVGSQLPPEKKSHKSLYIKIAISVILLALAFTGLVFANVITFGEFKTITYVNGKGDTFKLKFYAKHSVKSANSNTSPNLKELASKVSNNGNYPLIFWMEKVTTNAASFENDNCIDSGLQEAFSAHIDYINKDVAVCSIQTHNITAIYLATYHDDKNNYTIYMSQDVDFKKLLSSPDAARNGLSKLGMGAYDDDVKIILASIKPVN